MRKKRRNGRAPTETSVVDEIVHLRGLDLKGLRARWQSVSQRPAPSHLPRPLLFAIIAYRIQADRLGDLDHPFAPAARVARKFDQDLYAGFEYYSDFGQIGRFGRFSDQVHTLFAVTDFKLGVIDVNFGVGYGLTPMSDRWVIKTILGYAFPVPGSDASGGDRALTGLVNPMSHAQARILQP